MRRVLTREYTWGVKSINPEQVMLYNMTREEAERIAGLNPAMFRAAAIWTRKYPFSERAKTKHIYQATEIEVAS